MKDVPPTECLQKSFSVTLKNSNMTDSGDSGLCVLTPRKRYGSSYWKKNSYWKKKLSPLPILSMDKAIFATKVITELKQITKLEISPETGP